jgi:hypothetical protein
LPVDAGHFAIVTPIRAIRHRLTGDAVIAAVDLLDALLAVGLNVFGALWALDLTVATLSLRKLNTLRAFCPALNLGTFGALRAFDALLRALLNLLALGALRTFGASTLFAAAALALSCAFPLIVIVALSAGRGRNRQCGNAGGEKYPGHDEILLVETVRTARIAARSQLNPKKRSIRRLRMNPKLPNYSNS